QCQDVASVQPVSRISFGRHRMLDAELILRAPAGGSRRRRRPQGLLCRLRGWTCKYQKHAAEEQHSRVQVTHGDEAGSRKAGSPTECQDEFSCLRTAGSPAERQADGSYFPGHWHPLKPYVRPHARAKRKHRMLGRRGGKLLAVLVLSELSSWCKTQNRVLEINILRRPESSSRSRRLSSSTGAWHPGLKEMANRPFL